jgi:hypothetical protein
VSAGGTWNVHGADSPFSGAPFVLRSSRASYFFAFVSCFARYANLTQKAKNILQAFSNSVLLIAQYEIISG